MEGEGEEGWVGRCIEVRPGGEFGVASPPTIWWRGTNGLLSGRMERSQRGTHLALRPGGRFWTTLGWLRIFVLFLLFLLILLLLTGLDSVATGFDPVHDPSDRHWVLARVIPTGGNTLLDHGENILASGRVPGIVSTLRCLSGGPVESGDAESSSCGRQRRQGFVSLRDSVG